MFEIVPSASPGNILVKVRVHPKPKVGCGEPWLVTTNYANKAFILKAEKYSPLYNYLPTTSPSTEHSICMTRNRRDWGGIQGQARGKMNQAWTSLVSKSLHLCLRDSQGLPSCSEGTSSVQDSLPPGRVARNSPRSPLGNAVLALSQDHPSFLLASAGIPVQRRRQSSPQSLI